MARTKGALNKTLTENKRSRRIVFRATELEQRQIHSLCLQHKVAIIDLIFMGWSKEIDESPLIVGEIKRNRTRSVNNLLK